MDIVQRITQTVEPSLSALGYALVQVKLTDGQRKTLTIMAERADDTPMSFNDCAQISRTAGALLEVDDPISTAYDLEVCSPGLDRPLTRLADFTRFAGNEAKLETYVPMEGRKRFRGILKGAKDDTIYMAMPEGEAAIEFSNIRTAKLVMTEAQAAQALKRKGG